MIKVNNTNDNIQCRSMQRVIECMTQNNNRVWRFKVHQWNKIFFFKFDKQLQYFESSIFSTKFFVEWNIKGETFIQFSSAISKRINITMKCHFTFTVGKSVPNDGCELFKS